jgi:hypothetical protein
MSPQLSCAWLALERRGRIAQMAEVSAAHPVPLYPPAHSTNALCFTKSVQLGAELQRRAAAKHPILDRAHGFLHNPAAQRRVTLT